MSEALLEIFELNKSYGAKSAVIDLNLKVFRGEIFGMLGPNGAGKTTTFKMVAGLLKPSSGRVLVGGYDIERQPLEAKRIQGFVPDTPLLYDKLTAQEFLYFVADLYDVSREQASRRAAELLRLFDLASNRDDLIDSFSHGMKQKIALAAALMHDPGLLILDEPTVGLDPKSARLIKDILRQLSERGVGIILSTHILEIAERMCDRIGIIQAGRLIAAGSVDELRQESTAEGSLEDIFLSLTGGTEYAQITEVLQ
ncbi:MAG TPA: ABC transporter ATP-binding protein [Anaerolineales bacterium]|nr:ABC transporter ATP-binding protein [Anaerolineales bacterium]